MQNTSVISREIVNKNIIFHMIQDTYDYNDLCRHVDGYKNLLTKKYNAHQGQTVMNALTGFKATALFLATSELGMITIVASVTSSSKRIYYEKNREWIDSKTKLMMPINFILSRNKSEEIFYTKNKNGRGSEEKFYCDIAEKLIDIDEIEGWDDFSPNNIVNAKDDTVLMRCCSSGTTGTPKFIEHTHGFMNKLGQRNSLSFYGGVVTTRKFMHGSSFATFFLPTLMSQKVTDIYKARQGGGYESKSDVKKLIVYQINLSYLRWITYNFHTLKRLKDFYLKIYHIQT